MLIVFKKRKLDWTADLMETGSGGMVKRRKEN